MLQISDPASLKCNASGESNIKRCNKNVCLNAPVNNLIMNTLIIYVYE